MRGVLAGVRRLSIAVRLTAFYAVASGVILAALALILYADTAGNLQTRSDEYINDEVNEVLDMLKAPESEVLLRDEMRFEAERKRVVHNIRVLDAEGKTLVENPEMESILPTAAFPTPTLSVAEAQVSSKARGGDGNIYNLRAIRAKINGFGGKARVVQIAMDVTPLETFLEGFRSKLAVAIAFGIGVTALAGAAIARGGLKPLAMITRTAEDVSAHRLNERISAGAWPMELSALATAFDCMMDRLEEGFTALSHYTGNLAHELRTPINSLMMEADITLMRPRTPEEYQKVIGSSMEEYERLSSMIDSLLFLARADNAAHGVHPEPMDVGVELARICEFYQPVAEDEGVRVTSHGEATLAADPVLFRRAVGNLVSNALKYTPAGGTVTVLARHTEEQGVEVVVADTGCGIEAEHLPRIFDRFYRGGAEKRRDVEGCGLGLAIVKTIMALHRGSIDVQSRPSRGTTVTLSFPPAPAS